jgi:putative transposase
MDDYESLSHTTWTCKYHVVFIPKGSAKDVVFGAAATPGRSVSQARAPAGIEGRGRASHARSRARAVVDSAEIRSVSGCRVHQGEERDPPRAGLCRAQAQFRGAYFWARGYFVNTVGRDEDAIRAYIRNQEKEDKRLEQLNLWR